MIPYEKVSGVALNNAKIDVSNVTYVINGEQKTISLRYVKVEDVA